MPVDRPLSHLMTLARLGLEEDLARLMSKKKILKSDLAKNADVSPPFITKILSGTNNYTLKTMAKLARAVGAVLEIRLADEIGEVVRVVDYETARQLDSVSAPLVSESTHSLAPVVNIHDWVVTTGKPIRRAALSQGDTIPVAENHG